MLYEVITLGQRPGLEVAVGIIVDHQGRPLVAVAEAADRQQRETAIGGGFTKADAKVLLQAGLDALA